jgi:hypothetical protein
MMDTVNVIGPEACTVHASHCPTEAREAISDPTTLRGHGGHASVSSTPTLAELQRAICCPTGACSAPGDCYAMRRDRDVPVRIAQAAQAVHKLLTRDAPTQTSAPRTAEVTVVPLTRHRPGVFTIDYEVGVPQDSAWQPSPDRSPSERQQVRQP